MKEKSLKLSDFKSWWAIIVATTLVVTAFSAVQFQCYTNTKTLTEIVPVINNLKDKTIIHEEDIKQLKKDVKTLEEIVKVEMNSNTKIILNAIKDIKENKEKNIGL